MKVLLSTVEVRVGSVEAVMMLKRKVNSLRRWRTVKLGGAAWSGLGGGGEGKSPSLLWLREVVTELK